MQGVCHDPEPVLAGERRAVEAGILLAPPRASQSANASVFRVSVAPSAGRLAPDRGGVSRLPSVKQGRTRAKFGQTAPACFDKFTPLRLLGSATRLLGC